AMFVCDRAKSSERDQWRRLFSTLRRLYRTEEERQLFKLMVEGATSEEAREHIQQSTLTLRASSTGEIEIFWKMRRALAQGCDRRSYGAAAGGRELDEQSLG